MITNNEFTFIGGEVRKITYILKSKCERNFVIESAKVELFHSEEYVKELHVDVNEHDIEFVIDTSTLKVGYYHVIMTCRINEETVKKKMIFSVNL